ncbi:MAG: hypothetical protein ACJAUD_001412 [Crocinitomicaceae bacterium]|jgi:hypothetical protein
MSRTPLLLGLIFFLIYRLSSYLTGETSLSMLVFLLPVGLLLLNVALRKKLRYKNWFLSSVNIFLELKTEQSESEISSDLLFEKLVEVINESEFQLLDSNEKSLNILCGTSANFWTWGENIYICLKHNGDGVVLIQFTSTTLFGNTSWNRNQRNYESFISSFESSLTI